jgi:hypothetical protein
MIQPEQLVGEEWAEWYRLTPVQRWHESEKLWQTYLAFGGSLEPDSDDQDSFFESSIPDPKPNRALDAVQALWGNRMKSKARQRRCNLRASVPRSVRKK